MKDAKIYGFLAGLSLVAAVFSVCLAQEQVGGTAQTLGVNLTVEPFMSVTVLTVESERDEEVPSFRNLGSYVEGGSTLRSTIEFEALEQPGIIEPDKHVQIIVSSNCTSWSVDCGTEGLTSEDDFIPPERLFVRSYYTDPGVDEGAGPGYQSLVQPKLVAAGSASRELSYEVFLKLEVTWEDSPGDYDGILKFTVLPTP